MRVVSTLEPQARPAVRPSAAPCVRRARQHLLSFLHVAAHNLREGAVAHPGLHGDGRGLARRPQHEETAREGALARKLRVGQLDVVLGALGWGEDGADLLARRLTDALALHAALAVAAPGELAHLLPRVLEDGDELLLLLGGEAKRLGQPIADLLRRLRGPAAGEAGPSAAAQGDAVLSGQAEAQGGVRDLEHEVLLRNDQ